MRLSKSMIQKSCRTSRDDHALQLKHDLAQKVAGFSRRSALRRDDPPLFLLRVAADRRGNHDLTGVKGSILYSGGKWNSY